MHLEFPRMLRAHHTIHIDLDASLPFFPKIHSRAVGFIFFYLLPPIEEAQRQTKKNVIV